MADLKTNTVNAWESTLSSALASGATTINVTDTTGSPAVPFYVVIDPGNDSKREVVLVDGSKTATTFNLSAGTSRGQDGTSDVAHDSGAVIAIVPVAALWNDLHDRVDAAEADIASNATSSTSAETITAETTSSTSFTDLATVGPTATITVGESGVLIVACSARILSADGGMAYSISSTALSVSANDGDALRGTGIKATQVNRHTGFTAGQTATITAKFKAYSGTPQFTYRRLVVWTY